MKKLFLYIWQLPQNLLALLYRIMFKVGKHRGLVNNDIKIYIWDLRVGVSLGNSIFIPRLSTTSLVRHEYGHTIQSKVLGPLYLVLIGIPSAIWNILYRLWLKNKFRYSWFFIESMADRLGKDSNIDLT